MSRPHHVALPVILVLLGGAAAARAQGLGDAAARERQKREAQKSKAPAPSYGNEDLPKTDEADEKKSAAPAAPSSPGGSGDAEVGSGGDAASVFAARKQRIADAESAVAAAQADVDRIEARVRQLQDMLNPMSPSYIYGSAATGDMAGAEARAREELQQSEPRLAEARKALAAAKQALEDAQLGRTPSPQS